MVLIFDPMNLGPLTTVFMAPLACSTDALYVKNNRDCAGSVSVLRGPAAELGTAPQYEIEGSPVVRQQRGRQTPFPPPPPPLVQTESTTGARVAATQELSPVSEAHSPA